MGHSLLVIKKIDFCLTPYIKVDTKWINDINVRPENIKIFRA